MVLMKREEQNEKCKTYPPPPNSFFKCTTLQYILKQFISLSHRATSLPGLHASYRVHRVGSGCPGSVVFEWAHLSQIVLVVFSVAVLIHATNDSVV